MQVTAQVRCMYFLKAEGVTLLLSQFVCRTAACMLGIGMNILSHPILYSI